MPASLAPTLSGLPERRQQVLRAVALGAVACLIVVKFWLRYGANDAALLHGVWAGDFRIYYFAAQAGLDGLNPYDPDVLGSLTQRGTWPFVYPPFWLVLLRPFLLLPFSSAVFLWLGLKLAALVWGWHGWRRAFGAQLPAAWLALFCLGAYGGALPYDLLIGNVTAFEFALLGWACAALRAHQPKRAALMVGIAASAKLLPLSFAALPVLLQPRRRSILAALALGAAAAAVLALDALLQPEDFRHWLSAVHLVYWFGVSLFSLALTAIQTYFPTPELWTVWRLPHIVFAIAVVAILGLAFAALRRRPAASLAIAFAGVSLLLCWPRLWFYSFALAVPATVVLLVEAWRRGGAWRAAALAAGIAVLSARDGLLFDFLGDPWGRFTELYALSIVWALGLALCLTKDQAAPAA